MSEILKWFEENKVMAVIRSSSADDAESIIKAAGQGGIKIFNISMQTPQSIRLIESYSKKDKVLCGASSIADGEMAQRAINAGAKFLSSRYTDRDVINVARHNSNFVIAGISTPTEAFDAYQFGADAVQVYPSGLLGGARYIRSLRSAVPYIKYIAGGEIYLDDIQDYLKQCSAVALDHCLFDRGLVRSNNWSAVADRAKQVLQKLEPAAKVAAKG